MQLAALLPAYRSAQMSVLACLVQQTPLEAVRPGAALQPRVSVAQRALQALWARPLAAQSSAALRSASSPQSALHSALA